MTAVTSQIVAAVERRARDEGFELDPAQRLLASRIAAFVERRYDSNRSRDEPLGWYVHGPVGRGKTWLMRAVFDALPVDAQRTRRVHLHTLFDQLKQQLGRHPGMGRAIHHTVDELFEGTEWLLFDEFHVDDPADAALLNHLLAELDRRDVAALVSSNAAPEHQMPDPNLHDIFQPGIDLLTKNFTVVLLDGTTDYRATHAGPRTGFASSRWLIASPNQSLDEAGLLVPRADEATTVRSGHYAFDTVVVRDREVWFDFTALCEARTTAQDFVGWVQRFDHWVITGVVPFAEVDRNAQQRFVWLLDVLADADAVLDIVSSHRRTAFLTTEAEVFGLARAVSRLGLLTEVLVDDQPTSTATAEAADVIPRDIDHVSERPTETLTTRSRFVAIANRDEGRSDG